MPNTREIEVRDMAARAAEAAEALADTLLRLDKVSGIYSGKRFRSPRRCEASL